jgi:hypothetical protein
MILKFQKITDNFTTHTLREPDYNDDDPRITELCTIGDDTYVHVPDDMVLPEQPFPVETTLEQIILTDELKEEIKALSPHVRLSYKRLQERIRSRYSIEDEQYFTRISIGALNGSYAMQDDEPGLIAEYQAWVEECREVARLERVALGLGDIEDGSHA